MILGHHAYCQKLHVSRHDAAGWWLDESGKCTCGIEAPTVEETVRASAAKAGRDADENTERGATPREAAIPMTPEAALSRARYWLHRVTTCPECGAFSALGLWRDDARNVHENGCVLVDFMRLHLDVALRHPWPAAADGAREAGREAAALAKMEAAASGDAYLVRFWCGNNGAGPVYGVERINTRLGERSAEFFGATLLEAFEAAAWLGSDKNPESEHHGS